MKINFAQLLVGFSRAMTTQSLAGYLGVSVEEVRARLRALTPEEESQINDAMEGK